MVQQAPKGVHSRDSIGAPEAPCAADQNCNEGHGKERGVDIGHKEGLGVCFVGEYRLYKVSGSVFAVSQGLNGAEGRTYAS